MSTNRIVGPDGQPVSSAPQELVTAKITARASLEHEPGEIAIEIECLLPDMQALAKFIARTNDATIALGQHAEIRAPSVKLRMFCLKPRSSQVLGWAQQIAQVSGGTTKHAFINREDAKKKPDGDPGAVPGDTQPSG